MYEYLYTLQLLYRVIKEGVQAAGANATNKHIEEISLCGMFLLEAARKADKAFNVYPPSTRHTTRDADTDTHTMTQDLLQRAVIENLDHHGPPFPDPTTKGMEGKASKGWIESVLQKVSIHNEDDT